MSIYNWFGLTVEDVVSSLHGTQIEDYSPYEGYSGEDRIINELDLQESYLLSIMNSKSLELLNKVEFVRINDGVTLPSEFRPIVDGDLKVYIIEKVLVDPKQCNTNSIYKLSNYGCKGNLECGSEQCFSSYECESYTINTSANTIDITCDTTDSYVYMSYNVDPATININGLKTILRNMTCCSLGNQLFGDKEALTKQVEYYCNNVNTDMLKSYIPGEYLKYNWLFPIKTGWKTGKFVRS